jgi:hypothetical protein
MQTLAQNGNGVAAYIDNLGEAQKTLVQEATSSIFPIAKDVKIRLFGFSCGILGLTFLPFRGRLP